MRKIYLLSAILLLAAPDASAQLVNWARNVDPPHHNYKVAVDRSSNLYIYSYFDAFAPHHSNGTVIQKYAPDGNELFRKEWNGGIYLSAMAHDGQGSFYICGYFKGQLNQDGFSLSSNGGTDAFIGRMDENGTVSWAIGFGGANNDMAFDLAFNSDSSEIVVTGGVDSIVMLYGYPVINTREAILVARFDLSGGLVSNRTFAFTPDEHGRNAGLEIRTDGHNGYYLLADRMGDHWNADVPSGSPQAGRYLFRLSNDLDILWSQFIISEGCYYGYSCSGMSSMGGSAWVPSFCSAKYGGTGRLRRLEPANGSTTFSLTNGDGTYYDTHAAGNRLYYVGNEEANGCPCEDNNPGFARIKCLDERNDDRILFSKYGFQFTRIVRAPAGNLYVFGYAPHGGDLHLQGKPVEQGPFIFSMQEPPASFEAAGPGDRLITLFPNPSSGYIEIVNESTIDEITVIDASGSVITQATPQSKGCTIWDLAPGFYFVRLKDAEGYRSAKILVAR